MRALTVFTAKSVEQILAEGGTSSWSLNPATMKDVRYAICTRNRTRDLGEGFEVGPEPHRSAFVVGKVSGLRKVRFANGRQRYLVCFSEYALIDVADFWPKHRSPVTYMDVPENVLNLEGLDWQPMPPPTHAVRTGDEKGASAPVDDALDPKRVLQNAKEQVAKALGVPMDKVTITVAV
jgi:hypothetical protein